jgi:PLP dependent protein
MSKVMPVSDLERRIGAVMSAVERSAKAASRDPSEVTVVAVSKSVDRAAVDAAYGAGLRHFGENRVLDAVEKFSDPLPDDAVLHLIGQLQTNKVAPAIRLFGVIESVDRRSLILELEKQAAKRGLPVPVLLQVNVAGEEQKAGCAVNEASELLGLIASSSMLQPRGLMTIAPLVTDPEEVRPVFRGLRELRDRLANDHPALDLSWLSMGMSNDFGVAIEEGATHVRVGRALFGG